MRARDLGARVADSNDEHRPFLELRGIPVFAAVELDDACVELIGRATRGDISRPRRNSSFLIPRGVLPVTDWIEIPRLSDRAPRWKAGLPPIQQRDEAGAVGPDAAEVESGVRRHLSERDRPSVG